MYKTISILGIILLFCSCSQPYRHIHWNEMYENIYDINNTRVSAPSSLDYNDDIRNYFVMDADTIYMIDDYTLNSLYEDEVRSSKKHCVSYHDFKCRIISDPKNLSKVKGVWCFYSAKANKNVIEYFSSHDIKECIERYCHIDGQDTLLIENDITVIYCLDKLSYNCFFNYGEAGNTKVTKIYSKNLLPRIPITKDYDIQRDH